jgi:drug/metabolite transporter (DMT)-like permease
MSEHLKGLLIGFTGVIILSPDTLLIRLAGIDHWALMVYRGLLMALGMAVISKVFDKTPLLRQFSNIGKAGVLVSICFTLSTLAFVNAVTYTSIANTLVILATAPLFAALYSRFILAERLKLATLIAIVCVMLGLLLVVGQNQQAGSWLGNVCALVSAMSIAATFVINRKKKAINMVPAISLSGVLLAFVAMPFAHWVKLDAHTILILLLMAVVVTLAFVMITIAPRYIPAAELSLILPLETVGGTALAWYFLNEVPSTQTLLGAAIILLTLVIHANLMLRQTNT